MLGSMRAWRLTDVLLLPLALLVLLFQLVYQRGLRPLRCRVSSALHHRTPLGRWHAGVARLSPLAALPLFLIPEACSRGGTLLSAWVLLHGEGWKALAVYAAAKLFAGSLAWWIYSACRPALLQLRAFAWLHAATTTLGRALTRRRGGRRLTAVVARLRSGMQGEVQR